MSKKCTNCGAELEDNAVFCDECGAKQETYQPVYQNQAATVPKSNTGFGIASLVLGIIAVCTLGMWFVPEILGLVFGIITLKNEQAKHGMAKAGVILSVISIVVLILVFVLAGLA